MATELSLPMPAGHLVPHRGRMLLLGELVSCGEGCAEARACFSADSPFLGADGEVDELALVELVAQTYAAMRGYDALRAKRPVLTGYLVGISKTSLQARPRADEELRIRVRTKGVFATFVVVDGEVLRGEETLLRGAIKTYEVPRGEE